MTLMCHIFLCITPCLSHPTCSHTSQVPWTEVGAAILQLEAKAFTDAEDIQTVMACLPSEDERNTLQVC